MKSPLIAGTLILSEKMLNSDEQFLHLFLLIIFFIQCFFCREALDHHPLLQHWLQ